MEVKIKYHEGGVKLQKIEKGDWIDLYASKDYTMKSGDFQLIDLGVSIEIPKGYEAYVVPRSSTFKNFGIIMANSIGIIDESYCGDNDIWRFAALAMRDTEIKQGDKIAQFRLMEHMPAIEFVEVESLGNADRGGCGTTGKR